MSLYYKIHRLSARAVLGFAVQKTEDRYSFLLSETETKKCLLANEEAQEENALFYQIMCALHDGRFPEIRETRTVTELADVIFIMDLSGVFDRQGGKKNAERQKKAESLFRPEGVTLNFGGGTYRYLAFERSGSMSRQARLTFLRSDLCDAVRRRIMLDMTVGRCQLSKLYAYNGLMLSGGTRIDGIDLAKKHRVVVVKNHSFKKAAHVITVEGVGRSEGFKTYRRVEDDGVREIVSKRFDGEGLVSKAYAEYVDKKLCGKHTHHSFQVRMPFVKGMLHEVDYKDLMINAGGKTITDIWGEKHPIEETEIILTESMCKGLGWMTENGMNWDDYWAAFKKYDHALYITGVSKERPEKYTELNYQFLATLSMPSEEFRPADLPAGWEHSPADDPRDWITKATEQRYYDLRCNENYRLHVFDDDPAAAAALKKNPLFIHEPALVKQLDAMAERTLKDYAVGHLLVEGDVRYLSGDLLEMIALTMDRPEQISSKQFKYFNALMAQGFQSEHYYAPKAAYTDHGASIVLRNPHIARNEEIRLQTYKTEESHDNMRQYYLGHLSDVLMIDIQMLAAERLGGADYDGDMVKTIADPIVRRCVERNYEYGFDNRSNIPLLLIPSEEPVLRNADDWHDRFITVRDTFSSRVGQICNAAFDRSVIAYDENSSAEERERCRRETETLAILVGLEIDSAKSGVKPNLDEYLKQPASRRSRFLQYKTLMDDDGDNAWYEITPRQKRKKLIEGTDWNAVTSNVERLPYYAYLLEKHTPKPRPRPAKDSELFRFAVKEGWERELDKNRLSAVKTLLKDYEACLARAQMSRAPIRTRKKEQDIDRILYMRGQEQHWDVETLYAAFSEMNGERVTRLRRALRAQNWHLMDRERRMEFLEEQIPELGDLYELFVDFRAGGFRVLGDLVCDADDENAATERRRLHRDTDSEAFTVMMNAYEVRTPEQDGRTAISAACRKLLRRIARPRMALRYVVAVGKRGLLWDLLPEEIAGAALRRTDHA